MFHTISPLARRAGATLLAATALGSGIGLTAASSGAAPVATRPARHTIHVEGVTLRVPTDWHQTSRGCVVDDNARKVPSREIPYGVTNCQLQVFVGRRLISSVEPDRLYFDGDPVVCKVKRDSVLWGTRIGATKPLGGQPAAYRRFVLPCVSRPAEQWFVGDRPGVLIQRTHVIGATERAARYAVRTATLPPQRTGLSRSFTGRATRSGHTGIVLDPIGVYENGDGTRGTFDERGRSRFYDIPTHPRVVYFLRGGDIRYLDRGSFLHDVRHGFPGTGHAIPVINIQSRNGTAMSIRVFLANR